jgi:plastocyanin
LIGAALQDQTAQTALGVTRARVTFTTPGTYDYYCILHDDLGMVGTVVVLR